MDTSPPGADPRGPQAGRKLLRVATKCGTLDEFVRMFSKLVDETSVLIFTSSPRAVGTRQPFAIQLKNNEVVLSGECEVIEARHANGQPGARSSMRLRILEMDEASKQVHRDLLARGAGARATRPPPTPLDASAPRITRPPTGGDSVVGELRTPGASYTLPANPFGELPDQALEYFIECTLYEETGLHPLVDLQELRAPAAPPVAATPSPHSQVAFFPVATPVPPPMPLVPEDSNARINVADMIAAAAPRYEEPPPAQVGRPFRFVDDNPAMATVPVERLEPRRSRWVPILVAAGVAAGAGFAIGYLARGDGGSGGGGGGGEAGAGLDRAVASVASTAPATASGSTDTPPAPTAPAPAASDPAPAAPAPAADTPPAASGTDCTTRVLTDPPSVNVTWSGTRLGDTPLDGVGVPCGDALVVLEHPRYERAERKVTATSGTPVEIQYQMVRPAGRLDLVSTPPGATFTVGGKTVGKGPTATNVSAFTQVSIKAELSGYKPWSQKVYVRGRKHSVHAKLEALPKAPRPRRPGTPAPSPR